MLHLKKSIHWIASDSFLYNPDNSRGIERKNRVKWCISVTVSGRFKTTHVADGCRARKSSFTMSETLDPTWVCFPIWMDSSFRGILLELLASSHPSDPVPYLLFHQLPTKFCYALFWSPAIWKYIKIWPFCELLYICWKQFYFESWIKQNVENIASWSFKHIVFSIVTKFSFNSLQVI